MAKTIKFNLILDGKPVRDIEGLQENFCINDVLELYQKGLLQKWLKVRGFSDNLKKVEKLKDNDSIIIELVKIFEVEKTQKEIMEATYSLKFWEERKLDIEEWEKRDNKIKEIIADYHNGYDTLKGQIKENRFNMPFLKKATKEIAGKYLEIFKINYWDFFYEFVDDVPLVIFAILMNQELKELFLKDKKINKTINDKMVFNSPKLAGFYSKFSESTEVKKRTQTVGTGEVVGGLEVIDNYNYILELSVDDKKEAVKVFLNPRKLSFSTSVEFKRIEDINEAVSFSYFSGVTEGYWKDLESKEKKYMIISMEEGNFLRNIGKKGEELSASDVNGKFLILDGIDYKSNNASHKLIYMEV